MGALLDSPSDNYDVGRTSTPGATNAASRLSPVRSSRRWLLLPTLLWYFFFLVIPLGIIGLFSVLHKGAFGRIEYFFDPTNYQRVFEPLYLRMVFRSLGLASFTTLSCFLIGFPVAYYMAKSPKKTKAVLLGLVVVPFWTNFIIRVYALKLVVGDSGLLNQWLLTWGLISAPLNLSHGPWGIALGMVYNYLPFMILPLFVSLERFDFLLLDAAYDLGANRWKTLFRVLLPLILPGVVTGCLFVFIPAFGEFVIPDLLGGSQSMYVGNLITETFLKSRDWPFGSALSVLLVALSLLAFWLQQRKQEG